MSKAPTTTSGSARALGAATAAVALPNAAFVSSDSQPAMTAHNNGDGTWSVTEGPNGTVLQDGLHRDQALAIVGGKTGAHKPKDEQERRATNDRVDLEQKLFNNAAKDQLQTDGEAGAIPEHQRDLPVATAPAATADVPAANIAPAPAPADAA